MTLLITSLHILMCLYMTYNRYKKEDYNWAYGFAFCLAMCIMYLFYLLN